MGDSVIDDLYGDLDEIHENAKLETVKENEKIAELNEKLAEAKATIDKLTSVNVEQEGVIETILKNGNNLLVTARSEIDRKTRQFEEIRRDRDNVCFRRNNKLQNKPPNKVKTQSTQTEWYLEPATNYDLPKASSEAIEGRDIDTLRIQKNPFASTRNRDECQKNDDREKRNASSTRSRRNTKENTTNHKESRAICELRRDHNRPSHHKHRNDQKTSPSRHEKKHADEREKSHSRNELKRKRSHSPGRERKSRRSSSRHRDRSSKKTNSRERLASLTEQSNKPLDAIDQKPNIVPATKSEPADLRNKLKDAHKKDQNDEKASKQNDEKEIIDGTKMVIVQRVSEPTEQVIAPISIQITTDLKQTGDTKMEEKTETTAQVEAEDGEIVVKLESEEMTKTNEANEERKQTADEENTNPESGSKKEAAESEVIKTEQIQQNVTAKNRKRSGKTTECGFAKQQKMEEDHVIASSQSPIKPEKENEKEIELIAGSAIESAEIMTESLQSESSNPQNVEEKDLNLNQPNATDTPSEHACKEDTSNGDKLNDSKENHCTSENAIDDTTTKMLPNKTETPSQAELNNTNKFEQSEYRSVKNVSTSSTDYVIVEDENSDVTIFVTRKQKKKKKKKKEKQ